jgi:glycosyltransferase 2 family protein
MLRKIFKSKWIKFGVTVVLIYFAFKKVDIVSILKQLSGINLLSLFFWLTISTISLILIAYRWSLLLIKNPKISDISVFAKSIWSASFYGLFVPTSAAGDVFKWIIIDDKYPKIPKSKVGASILLDRFIGMSVLVFFGFVSQFFGKFVGVEIPNLIRIGLSIVFGGCLVFYGLVFTNKASLLFKIKWLEKIKDIGELVNKENSKQILKCIGVSLISDFLWIWQTWMISQYFGANLSFVEILIYLPLISTILILPISIAGFGAREQLYLYFLSRPTNSPESLLLTSTILGIIGIINSLVGGLVTLTPEYRKKIKR